MSNDAPPTFMKTFLPFACAVLLAAGGGLSAAPETPGARPTADAAFSALDALVAQPPPSPATLVTAALKFCADYPQDERAGMVLNALPQLDSLFAGPGRSAFRQALKAQLSAALEAPGLDDARWEALTVGEASSELYLQAQSPKPDLAEARSRIQALAERTPQARALPSLQERYVQSLLRFDPGAVDDYLRKLADSPNGDVARMARSQLRLSDLRHHPLDLAFTAVDGRAVDLSKLRGKVVLVDFWATWCRPCLAELPNVKRVYAAYHDRGFEVVGVSFDKAPDPQNPAPFEKSAGQLQAFTAEQGMPWPQYYDGKYWANALGVKYDIHSIPAMFLLDKEGRLSDANARGEQLEAEVKELLSGPASAGSG
jgi:thiol-disulfide isomerase/thioredoxin